MSWFDKVNKKIEEAKTPIVEIVNGIDYMYEKVPQHYPVEVPPIPGNRPQFTLICRLWEMNRTESAKGHISILKAESDVAIIERNKLPVIDQKKTKYERLLELETRVKEAKANGIGLLVKLYMSPTQAKALYGAIGDKLHCAFTGRRIGSKFDTKHVYELLGDIE